MQMLPRTQPRDIDDLIVQVALVRPGPIQGGAVHPYIERRKRGREDPDYEIPYEHPLLEPVLEETLGTIVFQEQVIEVAMALAGLQRLRGGGAAAGDEPQALRGGDRREHHQRFVAGAAAKTGSRGDWPRRVWGQIQGFSGFGFPKAHSAAFGLLAYQSAWLRIHYGPEFLCSLLNEQPMGFYPPDSLVHEAQRRGIRVAAPDANRSQRPLPRRIAANHRSTGRKHTYMWGNRPVDTGGARRAGGAYRARLRERGARRRRWRRWSPSASAVALRRYGRARLALRGRPAEPRTSGLGGRPRRHPGAAPGGRAPRGALAASASPAPVARRASGTQLALPLEPPGPPGLEPLGEWGRLIADYRSTGMTLAKHPMKLLRPRLDPAAASAAPT